MSKYPIMPDCIFCQIIRGEIPAAKVYEDDDAVAFLDIQPINPGHALVVPKKHHADCLETPDETMAALMRTAKRVAHAALKATGAQGFNVGINCGPVAGQIVMHTHVHVMPRFPGDGHRHWEKRPVSKEEMERVAQAMKKELEKL